MILDLDPDEGMAGRIRMRRSVTHFLVAAEVPVQRGVVRAGDRVRVLVNRPVVRVGYRLHPNDFREEAERLARTPEVHDAMTALRKALGLPSSALSIHGDRSRMREAVCVALVKQARFGGPDRGVVVDVTDEGPLEEIVTVWGTRRHQLGIRYPATGSHEDYEPGGLDGRRTITVCETNRGDFLSGDLEVVPDEVAG